MSEALHSYDAEKVQTKVSKPEGKGVYNVEELFSKTAEDIETVKRHLDDFKGKKLKSMVRLELQIADGKAVIPTDLATKIPEIDLAIKLPACALDNTLIVDEKGTQLMVDLKTGELSGTPSVKDKDAAGEGKTVYKPLAVTSFKVFPTGTWTLETVPTEDLLNKDEILALAYGSAVGKIIEGITTDKTVIESIKEAVGPEVIEGALSKKADIKDVFSVSDDGKKTPLFREADTKIERKDLDSYLLARVDNEEQLEKDVNDIKESYDASKVLVSQTKDDGTRYSTEEILNHKFYVRKKVIIDDLTKTKRRDIFGDKDMGLVKKEVLKVYDLDLNLLYTQDGEPLEINFDTGGELSGTPHALDQEEYRTHHAKFYTKYTGKAYIFPQMETTLMNLEAVSNEDEPEKKEDSYASVSNRIVIGAATAWEAKHEYRVDEVVMYSRQNYICKKRHISGDAFDANLWIQLMDGQAIFGYVPEYSQVEESGVTATAEKGVSISLKTNMDDAFCARPVDIFRRIQNHGTTNRTEEVKAAGQVVKMEDLLSDGSEKLIKHVTVTKIPDTSKVAFAATGDGTTYQVYDKETKTWKAIDISKLDEFQAGAMDSASLTDVPEDAWRALVKTKLGLAYILQQDAEADAAAASDSAAKIGDVTIQMEYDLPDSWTRCVFGKEYGCSYKAGGIIEIGFYASGDFKINYDSGYRRGE